MSRIIKLDSKNFNRHTPEGMDLLEKSITEVGAIEGVTVDADGEVITGNARKETFDKLGYKPKFIDLAENEYPVIQTDLTGEKRVKAAIYANTVAQKNINLDLDLIKEVAIEEYELEFEELGVDFEDVHLEAHEDDFNEVPPENPITVLGDLYEIGVHRLLCGDSTKSDDVEKLMGGGVATMVFADPDFSMDIKSVFSCYINCKAHSDGAQFWVTSDKMGVQLAGEYFNDFAHFFIHDFKAATLISNKNPMQQHNMILKFGSTPMNNLKDGFTTIVKVATTRPLNIHKETPMAKRIELPFKFIGHYSDKGGVVLDVFLHSGNQQ